MPVEGVRVGHFTDREGATGCTVVIPPPGSVGGVDVRGGGASTREAALMDPVSNVPGPTALLFTGGSALGLDASAGVTRWCRENGVGHDVMVAVVPIVVGAVIFDLGISGGRRVPGPDDAHAACVAAREGAPEEGSVGAGTGATVGKYFGQAGWCKGGLGWAEVRTHDGATVCALVVVNAFGDVRDEAGRVIAGAWDDAEGFVDTATACLRRPPQHPRLARTPSHTTLACVITDAALTPVEATHLARGASAGMCRAIAPVNTSLDGDVAFSLATGRVDASPVECAMAAATATERAIRNAVRLATPVRGVPTGAMRAATR